MTQLSQDINNGSIESQTTIPVKETLIFINLFSSMANNRQLTLCVRRSPKSMNEAVGQSGSQTDFSRTSDDDSDFMIT